MPEENPERSEEDVRRQRIRQWYHEAKAVGVSDNDFFREMMSIVSLEELEDALDEDAR